MTNSIKIIREFMNEQGLNFLLVNSTNKYLMEYTPSEENSRYALTGFSGSTGDALVTPDKIYLFVDGRYHIQADMEVNHDIITVVKLKTGQIFLNELIKKIPQGEVLGIFSKKNSQKRVEYLKEKGVNIRLIKYDPLDKNIEYDNSNIVPVKGVPVEKKIEQIADQVRNDASVILITNLEEVSYLFNLRDFSKNYSSNIRGKAVIINGRARLLDDIDDFVESYDGKIGVDKSTINAYDYALISAKAKILNDSPIKLMKAIKTDDEIAHYKEAFRRTDLAVKAIRDFIENNDNISEYDISEQLETEFKRFGAKSLSFKSIVAKDKNSALAHYSKCSKNEIVKDGSLILIDCGAYYKQGLATDITRVFVKGEPTELQKRVYTTVLKMFLNAYNYTPHQSCGHPLPQEAREKKLNVCKEDYVRSTPQGEREGFIGYDIDALARKIYSENEIEGFVFNHGLGHGIGVSVHEYPPNLSKNELAKVEIKDGMCFTIEPGLYNEEHFGIRLENSCYMKDGKINSFVKMNYEKKLIDFSLLTEQEKEWLKEFEVL